MPDMTLEDVRKGLDGIFMRWDLGGLETDTIDAAMRLLDELARLREQAKLLEGWEVEAVKPFAEEMGDSAKGYAKCALCGGTRVWRNCWRGMSIAVLKKEEAVCDGCGRRELMVKDGALSPAGTSHYLPYGWEYDDAAGVISCPRCQGATPAPKEDGA